MSITPTSSPAGWYPAPDGSSATWWWDGSRWTPPGQQPSVQPATGNRLAQLAMATKALLVACGVMSVATIGVETFGISAVTGYLDGHPSALGLLDSYDQITFVVSILSVVALLGAGVLWVLWQYRAAKQFPGRTRRSPGWHVGSWFVPVISFWFPYQNVSDLWSAVGRARPSWQINWWLCWLAGNLVIQASGRLYLVAEDLEQFRVAMSVSIVGEVLLLVAVPFAWLVVHGITQGAIRRSADPVSPLAY